jgi:hypothetical protein
MRRFRRVHGVEALADEMPLAVHFFDCLMTDGRSLIDAPYAERWAALERLTGGRYLAERIRWIPPRRPSGFVRRRRGRTRRRHGQGAREPVRAGRARESDGSSSSAPRRSIA